MLTPRVFFASFLAFFAVNASPLNPVKRQATTTALDTTQINAFTPFTHFASTAYCDPSTTINWSCGGKLLLMTVCAILTLFGRSKL